MNRIFKKIMLLSVVSMICLNAQAKYDVLRNDLVKLEMSAEKLENKLLLKQAQIAKIKKQILEQQLLKEEINNDDASGIVLGITAVALYLSLILCLGLAAQ